MSWPFTPTIVPVLTAAVAVVMMVMVVVPRMSAVLFPPLLVGAVSVAAALIVIAVPRMRWAAGSIGSGTGGRVRRVLRPGACSHPGSGQRKNQSVPLV